SALRIISSSSMSPTKENLFQRIISSFKPALIPEVAPPLLLPTVTSTTTTTAENEQPFGLKQMLKHRHLQMIGIGTTIGTGLFVGSGLSVAQGGPGSVLIAHLIIACLLYIVVHALTELTVMYPIQGSFNIHSTRFLDPAWGFTMSWLNVFRSLVLLPLQLSAAAITIQYWKHTASLHVGFWITIFFLFVILIHLFNVRGYGETQVIFATVKVLAVAGFIILAVVIDLGGSPSRKYFGVRTWTNPGAFNNGFPGLLSVFVNAALAFGGSELIGYAAAESENPHKTVPSASKQAFWYIAILYIVSLLLIGFIVPFNSEQLLKTGGGQKSTASTSPFVIVLDLGGFRVLPDIFNGIIVLSVLSAAISITYGSSRLLTALTSVQQAPKCFSYIDRNGRPLVSFWLLAITGLARFFIWGNICACHIRFRQAWKYQGHTLDELPFRSGVGVIGSYIGLILNVLCLMAQLYIALWPVGQRKSSPSVKAFFQAYLAVPVVILIFLVYKLLYWKSHSMLTLDKIDLVSGRRQVDLDDIRTEKAEEE
ncbi:unnamed protein product, partial [Didymodactylos carnosus]